MTRFEDSQRKEKKIGILKTERRQQDRDRRVTSAFRSGLVPHSPVLISCRALQEGRASKGEAIPAFISYSGAMEKVCALCAVVHPVVNRGGLFTATVRAPSYRRDISKSV